MNGQMERPEDKPTDIWGRQDRRVDGQMDGWMDGQTDGWTAKQTGHRMDRQTRLKTETW